MKKDAIIKKLKNGFKIAGATALLAVTLISCSPSLDFTAQEYASQETISETADFLNCDLSYIQQRNDGFVRMRHNNGDPIYVCFDSAYSEDLKTKAIESLDYVFGIVGKINDNYHYEIVEKTEYLLKGNKTKIYYTFGDKLETSNAYMESEFHSLMETKENPFYYQYKLCLNIKNIEDDKELKYSLVHELLHAFGLGDVYTYSNGNKHYGNTIMNNKLKYNMITPNDLACLISLYADEDCDLTKMQSELKKYENKFYKVLANNVKDGFETTEMVDESNFMWTTNIIEGTPLKIEYGYNYEITVENETYWLQIYDYRTNELIDECRGEVYNHEGVLILKNIKLKNGMNPYDQTKSYTGGFIQDFAIMKFNGNLYLYDHKDNKWFYGETKMLKKGLTN